MVPESLARTLRALPCAPGVYLLRDATGEVIYVGKAVRLRERVRTYFQPYHQERDPKVLAIARAAAELEFIVTRSETEALVLEEQLIKSYRPRFNVRLKDDKRFPYLKITLGETWPRLEVTRRLERDGARYFGPYTRAQLVRETVNALRRCFPVRTCADPIEDRPTRTRPCLDFFLKACPAPCVGRVPLQAYRATVEALCRFLEGRDRQVLSTLRARMEEAASNLAFERAARLRDALEALTALVGQPKAMSAHALAARDVVGLACREGTCAVQVFFMREGELKGRERFSLEVPPGSRPEEVLYAFLTQFYAEAALIPREVLLPVPLEEAQTIETWLGERLGARVRLVVPRRGRKRRLVALATRNAELALFELEAGSPTARAEAALEELQRVLGLPRPPRRVEGYDISNLQGRQAVGAMVVFRDGRPAKAQYRRFRIRTVRGADDFAMLAEVLERRFRRGLTERHTLIQASGEDVPVKFADFPDLIVVDGGKGQLGAARAVLEGLGLSDLPLVALAKKHEELFLPGRRDPLVLPQDSRALQLLRHLRDEAHRFGLAYHRSLRQRRTVHSALDAIPGVGPKRKALLLKHFGSLERVRAASLEALEAVPGLPAPVARQVYDALHEEHRAPG